MENNIIQFPQLTNPACPEVDERKAKHEQAKRQLVLSIRQAANDPKRKLDYKDVLRPAQTVDRLVAEAKKRKITQRIIKEAFNLEKLPLRHLERLRVAHEFSPDEAKSRANPELVRKIKPYVQVIDLLSKILEHKPDDQIYEAFANTAFAHSAAITVDDGAAQLSWLLHEMAKYVIRSEHLLDYFDKVRKVSGRYEVVSPVVV
jgi:hypothetical protein